MLDNLIIRNNTAESDDGGGILVAYSNSFITNTEIYGNNAVNGGGIKINLSDLTIKNVLFHNNHASYFGGSISFSEAVSSLINCTFSQNTAGTSGGAINSWHPSSVPVLINCILWNDTPQEISFGGGGLIIITYSDIENGTGQSWFGTGCIDSDPLFIGYRTYDYHLTASSPCIDAGSPDPQYHDPDGTFSDIGAYYYHQNNPTFPNYSLSFDGVDDYVDIGDVDEVEGLNEISIEAWIKPNNLNT